MSRRQLIDKIEGFITGLYSDWNALSDNQLVELLDLLTRKDR